MVFLKTFYLWRGLNENQEMCNGEIEAENIAQIVSKLHIKKIIPFTITKKIKIVLGCKKIKKETIAFFTKQLASLLNSNIPLISVLSMLEKESNNKLLKKEIQTIKNDLENGDSFTLALAKKPLYFDSLYQNLIAIGEKTGTLDLIVNYIASYLENTIKQKRKIKKALFYPAMVITLATLVTILMLVLVIPQFKNMFANFGAELPLYTQAIIKVAEFLKSSGWMLLLFFLFLLVIFFKLKKRPYFAQKFEQIILQIPFLGKTIKKIIICRIAKVLNVTFKSGLPLLDALQATSSITNNHLFTKSILAIKKDVERGITLEKAFLAQKVFPEKITELIAIGEESGNLEEAFAKIASDYQEEIDEITTNLNNLLEPIIIIILGIVIGSLIIGMYLPIFKIGNVF